VLSPVGFEEGLGAAFAFAVLFFAPAIAFGFSFVILFREGVDNFQRITRQLLDASDAIEQVTSLYVSGMADIGRKMDEAARAMRDQVASVGASDRVSSAADEVTKALSAMADLNPFWRRTHPDDS